MTYASIQKKLSHLDSKELVTIAAKSAAVAGGVAVAYEVFRHRRLLGATAVAAGAALAINRWLDGRCPKARHSKDLSKSDIGAASFPGENQSRATQQPQDALDEALMESFPASDPPASYRRA